MISQMARLRSVTTDEAFAPQPTQQKPILKPKTPRKTPPSPAKVFKQPRALILEDAENHVFDDEYWNSIAKANTSATPQTQRRQKPLRPIASNSSLLSAFPKVGRRLSKTLFDDEADTPRRAVRQSPRKTARTHVSYAVPDVSSILVDSESSSDENFEDTVIEEVSFSKSEEDDEMPRRIQRRVPPTMQPKLDQAPQLPPPLPKSEPLRRPQTPPAHISRPGSSDSNADANQAILRFSPDVRTLSPYKLPIPDRPVTPPNAPPSPSKSRLISPSKKTRVTGPPLRPSIDAFWSQDEVNRWNDQYSPKKELRSPKKDRTRWSDSDSSAGLNAEYPPSPRKSSPAKKDKAAVERKRAFEATKETLAQSFLEELDARIAHGQVSALAASKGGIKIIWSKKLNSTAGRANWRREAIRIKNAAGETTKTEYCHEASIELAEKVIDDEERLCNVLAHEFCHLCVFIVDGLRERPHGREFKIWAKKCSTMFADRGVDVTTKHSYAIDYKYIWECVDCGREYKRHSKSIDPAKHACGVCKARLIQTKPTARTTGPSEYQLFIKKHFQRIKKENASASHAAIMETLGRMYREEKAKKGEMMPTKEVAVAENTKEVEVEDVLSAMTKALDIVTIDD